MDEKEFENGTIEKVKEILMLDEKVFVIQCRNCGKNWIHGEVAPGDGYCVDNEGHCQKQEMTEEDEDAIMITYLCNCGNIIHSWVLSKGEPSHLFTGTNNNGSKIIATIDSSNMELLDVINWK